MPERVYMPDTRCLGFDMPDGTQYDTHGRGYIEADDLHAAVLKMYTGLVVGQRFVPNGFDTPSLTCSKCGFCQIKALARPECNKCGGAWEAEVVTQAQIVAAKVAVAETKPKPRTVVYNI